MNNKFQPPKNQHYSYLATNSAKVKYLVLILFTAVLSGLIINFIDKLHYNNLLLAATGQDTVLQSKLNEEKYDVSFLINNSNTQLNCYDLRTVYARNICRTHDTNSINIVK